MKTNQNQSLCIVDTDKPRNLFSGGALVESLTNPSVRPKSLFDRRSQREKKRAALAITSAFATDAADAQIALNKSQLSADAAIMRARISRETAGQIGGIVAEVNQEASAAADRLRKESFDRHTQAMLELNQQAKNIDEMVGRGELNAELAEQLHTVLSEDIVSAIRDDRDRATKSQALVGRLSLGLPAEFVAGGDQP